MFNADDLLQEIYDYCAENMGDDMPTETRNNLKEIAGDDLDKENMICRIYTDGYEKGFSIGFSTGLKLAAKALS